MRKLTILGLLIFITQTALAQTTKELVETLERKRFAAQVSKDYDFLEKTFADDLVYTHSSGKQDSKTTYIASIKEGKSVYNKVDVEQIIVRDYGKTAVVNGKIMVEQNPIDGKPNLLHLCYTVVYSKNSKKGWQLNTWQSLKLPN